MTLTDLLIPAAIVALTLAGVHKADDALDMTASASVSHEPLAPETSPRPTPRPLCRPGPFPGFCVVPSEWRPAP